MATYITNKVPTTVSSYGTGGEHLSADDLDALVDRLCRHKASAPDMYRAQRAILTLARLMRGEDVTE